MLASMNTTSKPHPLSQRPPVEPGAAACPSDAIPADLLFKGAKEIQIVHQGETYRLRITRNDKLILTK